MTNQTITVVFQQYYIGKTMVEVRTVENGYPKRIVLEPKGDHMPFCKREALTRSLDAIYDYINHYKME